MCLAVRRRVRLKRFLPHCCPQRSRLCALVTLEFVGHPEQRAEDRGAVVTGQIYDPSFDEETAQFDEVPRALAALDLPSAHVTPRPCRLMPVARGSVAPQRRQRRAQLLE